MIWKESAFSHLRPSTTPEMLDRSLSAATRFLPLLWGASLIFSSDHLFPLLLRHLPDSEATTPGIAVAMLGLMLLGEYASAVAFLALFQGMLFPLRPLSPKALLRTALRKLPAYFFTHLLYMTAIAMGAMITWGIFTAAGIGDYYYLRLAAAACAGVVALWITIRLCLAPIASLIEDCNPIKAFSRSWHLTSNIPADGTTSADIPALRWLAVAALPLLVSIAIAAAIYTYAHMHLGVRWPINWSTETASWSLNLYLFTTMFLAAPLYWAGIMALYVEYRMRHEALDFYLRLRERRRIMNENVAESSAKSD